VGAPLSGCAHPAPPPDVLLVTIDTLRADHVSAYGDARSPSTPAFDRIASEGVLFEQAVAQAPLTLPSHASILTGQWPFRHGVRDNGGFRLAEAVPTLAEALRAGGYHTASFVGAFVLDSRFGLDRGFELYDDAMGHPLPERGGYLAEARRDGAAVAAAAAAWLAGAGPGPVFLWVHLYDPHAPYAAGEPYRSRYPDRPYAAAVAQADAALRKVLEAFERRAGANDAIVAVTSDHGESLGEHGEMTHGVFLYDATLKVPLALRAPGLPRGARIPWQARLVDLAPTLLGLAGGPPSSGRGSGQVADHSTLAADGIDLSAALRGEIAPPRLPAYAESLFGTYHYGWSPLRALRESGLKWIEAPRPELYDLARDPSEVDNLVPRDPRWGAMIAAHLLSLAGPAPAAPPAPGKEDPETLARLRALGYVGGSAPQGGQQSTAAPPAGVRTGAATSGQGEAAVATAALPDPKDGIQLHARFEEEFRAAAARFDAGDYAGARIRAGALLRDFPEARDAQHLRALAALNEGRIAEARLDLGTLLSRDPGDIEALYGLGRLLEREGKHREAVDAYLRALAAGPERADLHLRAGRLLRLEGSLDEAERHLERAQALDPGLAAAAFERGLIRLSRGEAPAAETFFRQAARADPGIRGVHHNLALLLEEKGDLAGARREYEAEVGQHPDAFASHLNLGLLLGRKGGGDLARQHLEDAARAAPREPQALTALAAWLLREGKDTPRARDLLERALRADPRYTPARELLEKTRR
jgi:arylsulfatase A-like enzyme/tetratricopeptide (TPR) repeat protein